MLSGILLNWKMLEKFEWIGIKKLYAYSNKDGIVYEPRIFNLTNSMFIASKMRILRVFDQPILYVGDSISNWKLLSFFSWNSNDGFTVKYGLPQSFST